MTPQQIVGLAARLFAVWLAINALQAIGMAAAMGARPGAQPSAAPFMFAVLFLIAAILLWVFPMVVGHKLVPRTQFDNTLRTPAHELLVVASVVLGLWVIVVKAVPAIAYYISLAAFWVKNGETITTLGQSHHIGFMVGLIQLGVGLFLVLRANRFADYVLPQSSSHDQ